MRSAVSAPADARNQLDTLGLDRAPATSNAPPIKVSRYPMDRNSRRAVGWVARRSDQRSWARSGATRNEMPDAARTAPATMAARFMVGVYTRWLGRAVLWARPQRRQ